MSVKRTDKTICSSVGEKMESIVKFNYMLTYERYRHPLNWDYLGLGRGGARCTPPPPIFIIRGAQAAKLSAYFALWLPLIEF